MNARDEAGFSIIEALVALAIVAIAAAGLIRATEAHVDTIRGLELRAVALWLAEDRLTTLGLSSARDLPPAGEEEMLGHRWSVTQTMRTTDDPDLRAVDVTVHEAGRTSPQIVLHGFVDAGTTTR